MKMRDREISRQLRFISHVLHSPPTQKQTISVAVAKLVDLLSLQLLDSYAIRVFV